jgi:hypothetical protein
MIFEIFRRKKTGDFDSNYISFLREKIIITLVFNEKANFSQRTDYNIDPGIYKV